MRCRRNGKKGEYEIFRTGNRINIVISDDTGCWQRVRERLASRKRKRRGKTGREKKKKRARFKRWKHGWGYGTIKSDNVLRLKGFNGFNTWKLEHKRTSFRSGDTDAILWSRNGRFDSAALRQKERERERRKERQREREKERRGSIWRLLDRRNVLFFRFWNGITALFQFRDIDGYMISNGEVRLDIFHVSRADKFVGCALKNS